jgi:hypothetical protein
VALALSKYIAVREPETEAPIVEDQKVPDFRLKTVSNRNKNAPANIQVSPSYKIDFGKYKGKGKILAAVEAEDSNYFQFITSPQFAPSPTFKEALEAYRY